MEKIIDPVDKALLKAELTPDKKLRDTNRGDNEIYIVTMHDSPNVVREIGRLREIAFREAGGSTGNAIDLDEYDSMDVPYKQLIVWDPSSEAIIGGYRYLLGSDASFDENGQPILASAHQFTFSDAFIKDYLPHIMELGRSFVSPEFQASKAGAKSIFAMDNLWDGIITVIYQNPHIMYFFGKVTMYPSFDRISRDLILHFLNKHFGDHEGLITPEIPVVPEADPALMDLILHKDDLKEDYRLLKEAVRLRKTNIPPLVNSYMTSTPKMTVFGTALNELMNNIEDTAILIPFDDMYQDKVSRHIESFRRYKAERMKARFPLLDIEMQQKVLEKWESRRESRHGRVRAAIERRLRERLGRRRNEE